MCRSLSIEGSQLTKVGVLFSSHQNIACGCWASLFSSHAALVRKRMALSHSRMRNPWSWPGRKCIAVAGCPLWTGHAFSLDFICRHMLHMAQPKIVAMDMDEHTGPTCTLSMHSFQEVRVHTEWQLSHWLTLTSSQFSISLPYGKFICRLYLSCFFNMGLLLSPAPHGSNNHSAVYYFHSSFSIQCTLSFNSISILSFP